MKCPYCSNEMKSGYVQSGRTIIWSERKHKLAFNANYNNGEYYVAQQNLQGAYKEALCCVSCKKIIIDL